MGQELGNVFDAVQNDGPRGPDLYLDVDIPRAALGSVHHAHIPLTIDGTPRADPHGDGDSVPVNLPQSVQSGSTLRLRGMGGVGPRGGAAGDLYLTLKLVESTALVKRGTGALVKGDGEGMRWTLALWIVFAAALLASLLLI
jgi:hypothetical protein